jgi:hypothetical protein
MPRAVRARGRRDGAVRARVGSRIGSSSRVARGRGELLNALVRKSEELGDVAHR